MKEILFFILALRHVISVAKAGDYYSARAYHSNFKPFIACKKNGYAAFNSNLGPSHMMVNSGCR